MVTAKFSFEGGSNGANVAAGAGASTGDTNFDVVNRGTSATNAYDNTHPGRGSLGLKIATSATSATAYVSWTTTIGTQTTTFIRGLVFITGAPAANTRMFNFVGSAASRGNVLLNAAGKFILTNAAGSTVLTTATLPTNAQFRFEAKFVASNTVGQWEYKIWYNPRSVGPPDDTQTSAATQVMGGTTDTYRFGIGAALVSGGPFWLDDVGVSTDGYIGPEDPLVTGTALVNVKKCSMVVQGFTGTVNVTAKKASTIAVQGLGVQANVRSTSHYASTVTEGGFVMPLPTGWAAGDLVVIGVSLSAAAGTISGVSGGGWTTEIASQHASSSTSAEHAVFKRVMQVGDLGPTITGSSGRYAAVAVAIRGADTVSVIDVTSIFDDNTGITYPNLEIPATTPLNSKDLLLAFTGVRNGTNAATTTFTPPVDMVLQDQASSGVASVSNAAIALLSLALTSNSATGTKTATLTSSSGTSVNQMSSAILIRTYMIYISGGPKLKKMVVAGSITETTTISGGPRLKKMRVAGSITETTTISGGPKLKKMVVAGSITAVLPSISTVTGTISMKKMRVAGSITETTTISGGPKMKKMRVAVFTTETTTISGGPHLKKMHVHVNAVRPVASQLMVFTAV